MTMFNLKVAQRKKVKLMIALSGASGSGKTYSALQIAKGVCGDWSKVAVCDTENGSALYYAGDKTGDWSHLDFSAKMEGGYHPTNWIKMIEHVEKIPAIEVLILDSITHEWEGSGGCLESAENGSKNGFVGWKNVTPWHRAFIDKMRSSRLHIIATMRSKQDYVIEQNEKGKSQPRKVGTKSVQREGTDYEFGLILDIDMNHLASASKDRTGLFAVKPPFKISVKTGEELAEWANTGVEQNEAINNDSDSTRPDKAASAKDVPQKKNKIAEYRASQIDTGIETTTTTTTTIIYDRTNQKHQAAITKKLEAREIPIEDWDKVGNALHGRPTTDFEAVIQEVIQ